MFCVSIPSNYMFKTHRLLLVLVLEITPDVWDLPLIVHRCHCLYVAPFVTAPSSKPFGCILF